MVCIGEKKTNRLRDHYGVLHSSPLKSRWALTKMMSSRIREQGWKTGNGAWHQRDEDEVKETLIAHSNRATEKGSSGNLQNVKG